MYLLLSVLITQEDLLVDGTSPAHRPEGVIDGILPGEERLHERK